MQDYIEAHLTEEITLHMLAKAAGYSPWHSARLFKEFTGKPPFEYIRALRLSQAALRLRDRDVRIIDVALDFVFDSHEGFTRAFSKRFGITPKGYAMDKYGDAYNLKLFMPVRIRDLYLRIRKGEDIMSGNDSKTGTANTVFVQVVDRPARKIIMKRGIKATHYFEYCEEVGCDVWDVLTGIKEAIYEPIGMWLPEKLQKPGTSVYTQGVEVPVDYSGKVPEGFDIIDLSPCKMMIFQGQPFDDDDEKFPDAIHNLCEVMKGYNPELYGFKWADEDAPRFQLEPVGYRGYIEARPVRPVR